MVVFGGDSRFDVYWGNVLERSSVCLSVCQPAESGRVELIIRGLVIVALVGGDLREGVVVLLV